MQIPNINTFLKILVFTRRTTEMQQSLVKEYQNEMDNDNGFGIGTRYKRCD